MRHSTIFINDKIKIIKNKIKYTATLSTGPGGQNVNKVATAIMARYDLKIEDYPEWFILNLKRHHYRKISKHDVLIINANRYKSQKRNKKEALTKIIKIFKQSAKVLKPRKITLPSKNQRLKRLVEKKKNSQKKKCRKFTDIDF